jgi:ABC-type multidrug transport system ATPase subunit
MPATLSLRNATKTYGRTRALDGVNATFHSGQVAAVIGPNGAGKSTLLAALSTAAGLRSGEVMLDGTPLHRGDTAARRRLLWVPDAPFLVQARTPVDNIATYLDAYLIDAKTPDIAGRVLAAPNVTRSLLKYFGDQALARLASGDGDEAAI